MKKKFLKTAVSIAAALAALAGQHASAADIPKQYSLALPEEHAGLLACYADSKKKFGSVDVPWPQGVFDTFDKLEQAAADECSKSVSLGWGVAASVNAIFKAEKDDGANCLSWAIRCSLLRKKAMLSSRKPFGDGGCAVSGTGTKVTAGERALCERWLLKSSEQEALMTTAAGMNCGSSGSGGDDGICMKDPYLFATAMERENKAGWITPSMAPLWIAYQNLVNWVLFALSTLVAAAGFAAVRFDSLPALGNGGLLDATPAARAVNLLALSIVAVSAVWFVAKRGLTKGDGDGYAWFFWRLALILCLTIGFPALYEGLRTGVDSFGNYLEGMVKEVSGSTGENGGVKVYEFIVRGVRNSSFLSVIGYLFNLLLILIISLIVTLRDFFLQVISIVFLLCSVGFVLSRPEDTAETTGWRKKAAGGLTDAAFWVISIFLTAAATVAVTKAVSVLLMAVPSLTEKNGSIISNVNRFGLDTFVYLLTIILCVASWYWILPWCEKIVAGTLRKTLFPKAGAFSTATVTDDLVRSYESIGAAKDKVKERALAAGKALAAGGVSAKNKTFKTFESVRKDSWSPARVGLAALAAGGTALKIAAPGALRGAAKATLAMGGLGGLVSMTAKGQKAISTERAERKAAEADKTAAEAGKSGDAVGAKYFARKAEGWRKSGLEAAEGLRGSDDDRKLVDQWEDYEKHGNTKVFGRNAAVASARLKSKGDEAAFKDELRKERAGALARLHVPHSALASTVGKLLADGGSATNFVAKALEKKEWREDAAGAFSEISEAMGILDGEGGDAALAEADAALAAAFDGPSEKSFGRETLAAERERLKKEDPKLYSMAGVPDDEQERMLGRYCASLKSSVEPSLIRALDESGYGNATSRTKDAKGLVDKVNRMRSGNAGRPGRPEYCLADVPDAVGARVVVGSVRQVKEAIRRIGEKFGDDVVEMKNMFTDPSCADLPHKCVTFVVRVGGRLAEIQVATGVGQLAAGTDHASSYKPRPGMDAKDADVAAKMAKAARIVEARGLAKKRPSK